MDIDILKHKLIGKRVAGMKNGRDGKDTILVLTDGTELELWESDQDCCASASGDWVINEDRLEAVITNVEYTERDYYNGDRECQETQIVILHNQNPIALAECEADSGNGGYYYSVLTLTIRADGAETRMIAAEA